MGEQTMLGRIEISPTAIASIAARTVTQAYGVVGLASRNFADGIVRTLSGDPHRGVSVTIDGERIEIDLCHRRIRHAHRVGCGQPAKHRSLQRREGARRADRRGECPRAGSARQQH